ncbi:MAG: hypothetical protein M1834_000033 [Cirrosporium novae-zelandiae]|nr:MAG: hypothetical protein M1834_000033 [Cirrosporium novae-zelandiae]
MSDLQKITHCLLAAGGAVSEQGFHLLYNEEDDLVEKLWNGVEVQDERTVASNVREDTPATYTVVGMNGSPERLVFCIDQANFLKCYMYSSDEEGWEEADLGAARNTAVHPQSMLGTDVTPSGINVFFQNPTGKLQGLAMKGGSWELTEELLANPVMGTPLSIIVNDDELLLFYLNKDSTMRYQVKSHETKQWEDRIWETVKIETPVIRFKVSQDDKTKSFEAYVLTNGSLVQFVGNQNRVILGEVKNGTLVHSSTAESAIRTFLSFWEEQKLQIESKFVRICKADFLIKFYSFEITVFKYHKTFQKISTDRNHCPPKYTVWRSKV